MKVSLLRKLLDNLNPESEVMLVSSVGNDLQIDNVDSVIFSANEDESVYYLYTEDAAQLKIKKG